MLQGGCWSFGVEADSGLVLQKLGKCCRAANGHGVKVVTAQSWYCASALSTE